MMLSTPFVSLLVTLAAASSVAASITPVPMTMDRSASCFFGETPQCCKVVQEATARGFLSFVGGELYEYKKYGPANLLGFDCHDYVTGDRCAATSSSVLCCDDTQLPDNTRVGCYIPG